MKTHWTIPAAALAGGFAAFALRLTQNRTGFTGELPIPNSPAAIALLVFLAVMAILLGFLSWRLSGPADLPPPADSPAFLVLPALGCLLMALAGAADIYEGMTGDSLLSHIRDTLHLSSGTGLVLSYYNPVTASFTAADARMEAIRQTFCGFLHIGGAVGLVCFTALFRPGRDRTRQGFRNELFLLPPVSLLARLVMFYLRQCVNPVLERYVVEMMTLMLLSVAFFLLIAFPFRQGSLARYALCGGMAIVFCLCCLADSPETLSTVLINLGSSLLLLGYLLLFLWQWDKGAETVS